MKKYKDTTKENIEKYLKEYLENIYGKEVNELTYTELKKRVLPSYQYNLGIINDSKSHRNTKIYMNKSSVIEILNNCEKIGLPAFVVAQDIICFTKKGTYPLSQIKVKKNEK